MSSRPTVWLVLQASELGQTEVESVHQTPEGAEEAAYDIARAGEVGAWEEADRDRRLTLESGDLKILVEGRTLEK